jgi:peptidoglycan/LPS O-acetylase OafA/YrhL
MTAPETLAEQIARYRAHRRHVRRGKAITAAGTVALAVAGAVWPPLLVGLWWLTAYCVAITGLWWAANRLVKARRRPTRPAVPEPETHVHVRIVADVRADPNLPND